MVATAIDQLINHIGIVLDASTSMKPHEKKVVEVARGEIKNLAEKSQDVNQDTRISVYGFSDLVKCLVYDKDVLRLPDVGELYKIGGNTALIDASMKAIEDLEKTPQMYGDHAFLLIVITDGQENRSKNSAGMLASIIQKLPANWTVVALVPDRNGVYYATNYAGFDKDNVAVWDTTKSFEHVGQTIRKTTENFLTMRSHGIRGTKALMTLDVSNLSASTVGNNLMPVSPKEYRLLPVTFTVEIRPFVEAHTGSYKLGNAFYQLTKKDTIQPQKAVCVYDKRTGTLYRGAAARNLIGLPHDVDVQVTPTFHPDYDIFVQSTSVNRKLMPNTKVLVFNK